MPWRRKRLGFGAFSLVACSEGVFFALEDTANHVLHVGGFGTLRGIVVLDPKGRYEQALLKGRDGRLVSSVCGPSVCVLSCVL